MDAVVLLIDDDPLIRRMMELSLASLGYGVVAAVDGYEGVTCARTRSPDLILLDLRMPGMSGLECIAHLRSDPFASAVPVAAYTSEYMGGAELEHLYALGFDAYIPKSVTGPVLDQRIRQLIGRRRSRGPAQWSPG